MNDSKIEVWMRMYEEQVRHARHHETLRTQATNLIIIISAALLAYLSSNVVLPPQNVMFGIFLIVINLYGCILSLKHYERNQLHLSVSRHYRDVLSALSDLAGTRLNEVRRAGRAAHASKPKFIGKFRVYWLWSVLHGLIALLGVAIVAYGILRLQSPVLQNASQS